MSTLGGMPEAEKARALAHYAAQAAQAHKPQEGCAFATVSMGEASVIVEYEYEPGEAAKLYGPPEDCYEGSPETLTLLQALINGVWCDPADFASDALLEMWEADILLHIQAVAEAAADDYAESQHQARIDAREYA